MQWTCSRCKVDKPASAFSKNRARHNGLSAECKVCKSERDRAYIRTETYKAAKRKRRQQTKRQSPQKVWANESILRLRKRARAKQMECTISRDWLLDNLPGRCPLLKEAFWFDDKPNDYTPTVDRIDPTQGYTEENCWIISAKANRIKNDATLAEIEQVAAGIRERIDGN